MMHVELERLSSDNPRVLSFAARSALPGRCLEGRHVQQRAPAAQSQQAEMEAITQPVSQPAQDCSLEDFLVQHAGIAVTRGSGSTSVLLNQQ